MVKLTPGLIIGGIATTAAVGLVGYAAWFDYERRNNPEFRRKLLREQRKEAKASINAAKQAQAGQSDALRSAVRQMKNERPPASVEEREAYFLEQVAIGEALAAKGQSHCSLVLARTAVQCLVYGLRSEVAELFRPCAGAHSAHRPPILRPSGHLLLQRSPGLPPAPGM